MTIRLFPKSLLLLSTLLCGHAALGQTATINTYAGNDALFAGAGKPATSAQLVSPNNIAVDAQGNIYFSDPGLAMVLKVAANGVISIVAGNGLRRYAGDGGLAIGASLNSPAGLAFDSSGNLYIADASNSIVRKVDTNGIITTAVGSAGQFGFSGDGGPAAQALVSYPTGVAADRSGNLYIMDLGNNRVRMVNANGIVSTIAGNGGVGYTGDGGPATKATFNYPQGIAADLIGNVYVADNNNSAIRRIATSGIITTVAGLGNGNYGYSGDNGPATKAALFAPTGVAVDAAGNMYIADSQNERIRYVNTSGIITTIAGTGTAGFSGDGTLAIAATFGNPVAVALDASGAVYVADENNNRIRRFVVGGAVTTFAGTAVSVGDGGQSPQAVLVSPTGTAVDSAGNLYIADQGANRIRKVTPSGTIATVAGNGQTGSWGNNGPATSAALNSPQGVAVDSAGNLYIADTSNNEIRRVDAVTGKITAFAGPGCCYAGAGTGGDGGPATAAALLSPRAVAVDGTGNVYFVDQVRINGVAEGVAVRRVDTKGTIGIWVGGGPVTGFSGDGGSPRNAELSGSLNTGIAIGPDGSLYIADTDNNRVRKVDPAGTTITTVAGTGSSTYSGDGGAAASAGVPRPESVAVDAAGNLYIGNNTSVRKVSPNLIINAYAGNGQVGFSGDGGPATAASIAGAVGLAVDSGSNLYIADVNNRRIRQVQPGVSPAIALSSTSLTFKLAATGSTPTTQTIVVTNSGQGTLNWAASATTTSGGAWLSVSPASGNTLAGQPGTTLTVTVSPSGLAAGDYYGLIQVASPDASSQIQLVTVRLTIQTAGEDPPQITAGGIVSAASYAGPVAPGTLVAIFGSNFTDPGNVLLSNSLPWPSNLGGTSVTIAGVTVPVFVVTPGQINAMLPFGLAVNTDLPIIVTRNNAISAPQSVSMVSALPSVFTQNQSGQGLGAIIILHPDGSWNLAGNGNSATAGDTLEIYCTGLGDTNPRTVAGFPATASPLLWAIDKVTLTVGGVNVPVSFYGLTPGLAGLFQVNATLPTGIAPSPQAPVVLSQGGRAGVTVTIPIQ
jgi:uncharacterized protein (TIGR03437 family)